MLKKWQDLTEDTQRNVKNAFVHWKHDTTSKTFEEWANEHAFYVRKDGKLDSRHNHCEPSYLAD